MNDLYEKLIEYSKSDIYPFCMPGHKRNFSVEGITDPYQIDITEVEGFDDLHRAEGILKEITNKAERLYNAKHVLMSVNGSTALNIAAVNSVPEDGRILIAANCHRSVFNGAKLSKRKVVEIAPAWFSKGAVYGGVSAEDVERAFKGYPDIRALVITSPSYEGFVSDVKKIAEVVHAHNAYLIVDEAHGAHLPFCKSLPESAIYLGADIVIHSLHKTMGSLNQTALGFVQNEELFESFKEKLLMVTTTSPSYVLMASIEAALDFAESNKNKFEEYEKKLFALRKELLKNSNLHLVDDEIIGSYNITGLDKAKIMLLDKRMSGEELYFKLLNDFKLQFEKHGDKYALAMTTAFDTDEGYERLIKAAKKIDMQSF